MAYKPAFHAYSPILDSLFYPYSAIVDSFVIVSFFLRNITFRHIVVDQQAKFVLIEASVLVKVIAILVVIKPCA